MKNWNSLRSSQIVNRLHTALTKNKCYLSKEDELILGLPGTILEQKIFNPSRDGVDIDVSGEILQAYLKILFHNPNHIGNHTLGDEAEPFFKGTQEIEQEMLALCAENILAAKKNVWNGYVATGGTEANIHALYVLREYFLKKTNNIEDIVIVCSEDTHYSIDKAAKLLSLDVCRLPVDCKRQIDVKKLSVKPESNQNKEILEKLINGKKRYCIIVANMGTTMYGSVDKKETISDLISVLQEKSTCNICDTQVHVDGAFGGFIYPFTFENDWTFEDGFAMSFTLDPHKMLQVPYNSGIYLARNDVKDITYSNPEYVPGKDQTLVGSRSGASSVFAWIVLMLYGSVGGREFLTPLVSTQ